MRRPHVCTLRLTPLLPLCGTRADTTPSSASSSAVDMTTPTARAGSTSQNKVSVPGAPCPSAGSSLWFACSGSLPPSPNLCVLLRLAREQGRCHRRAPAKVQVLGQLGIDGDGGRESCVPARSARRQRCVHVLHYASVGMLPSALGPCLCICMAMPLANAVRYSCNDERRLRSFLPR